MAVGERGQRPAGFIYVDSGNSCLTARAAARYSNGNTGTWPEWRQAFRQNGKAEYGSKSMMWSKAELENLALGGAEVAAERVMKHLSRPENADIFAAENFSYLWGALGVAGLKGTDAAARRKIWQTLKENGVPDAFEKGILGDFTRELAARHKDNRLRAWRGLDNFQAGIKFQKTILEKLAKYDKELEDDVLPYCFDYKKLIDELNVKELGGRLKAYLERLRGQGAACGISGDAVTAVYEKRAALRRLCDVAAYTQRRLCEAEKDYLFRYLREAAADGFAPQSIGLDDAVLARLAADDALNGLSELEAAPLLARNAEIGEFAAGLEEETGFCEETAAKLVRHEPGKIRPLTERCLHLIETGAAPKGVVFALALLELNQVKSAVRILLELAKKGRATEMCGFLHRLLPKAKGAETLIADMVRINLQNLPELPAKGITASEHAAFRHYAAQRALCAVRDFAETGCAVQAAVLLKFLVQEGWLAPDNERGAGNGGTQSLMREFIVLANTLAAADSRLAAEMVALAEKMKLKVYRNADGILIGTADDNPLTAARRRLERAVLGATTIDLSAATAKMQGLEKATYGVYQSLKGALAAKNAALETVPAGEMPAEVLSVPETPVTSVTPVMAPSEVPMAEPEAPMAEPEAPMAEPEAPMAEPEAPMTGPEAPMAEPEVPMAEPEAPMAEPEVPMAEPERAEFSAETPEQPAAISELPAIEEWTDEADETAAGRAEDASAGDKKINISSILNISPKEIDRHFERIKHITTAAVKRAEEQAAQIKRRVESADLANSPSVGKIRTLAQKIKFFGKK